jgi:hypothetical protein
MLPPACRDSKHASISVLKYKELGEELLERLLAQPHMVSHRTKTKVYAFWA